MPGGAGGFPGFNMFGSPQEKGDALKQYVSRRMRVVETRIEQTGLLEY
jgi:hypothetical protein